MEAHPGKKHCIPSLTRAEFQDEAGPLFQETIHCLSRRQAGLITEEIHLRGIGPVPVKLLLIEIVFFHAAIILRLAGFFWPEKGLPFF
jgi:hypothetical protein